MGAPRYARFLAAFEEWFPQGLYLVGEIQAVTEYQSQENRARNRLVRPRLDEVTGHPLFRGTFADPSAEKDSGEVGHGGVRLRAPAGAAGGCVGVAVSAGGVGRHDRAAAPGGLRAGHVAHLGHPCRGHDSPSSEHRRERGGACQVGGIRDGGEVGGGVRSAAEVTERGSSLFQVGFVIK